MSEDQLQPGDTLDDRGVDDVLDEGYSPPEKLQGTRAHGTTAREAAEGETLDERIAQEEPDIDSDDPLYDDVLDDGQVGNERAGRLVAPDEGLGGDFESDEIAEDIGIDGAAASAEEAAIHIIDDDL